MAYIDQTQDPRRRATAITGVALVHTALALALLSLGVVGSQEIPKRWKAVVVTPDPSPTPTPPTARDPTNTPVGPTVSPPLPPLPWPQDPPTGPFVDGPILDDRWAVDDTPVVWPTSTPEPSPIFTPKGPVPANAKENWITTDDYPAQPLRAEIEGLAEYRLIVGSSGQVSSCEVTRSSGNRALDDATCRLISRRARFEAAIDDSGAKVVGSYTGKVRWEIPD